MSTVFLIQYKSTKTKNMLKSRYLYLKKVFHGLSGGDVPVIISNNEEQQQNSIYIKSFKSRYLLTRYLTVDNVLPDKNEYIISLLRSCELDSYSKIIDLYAYLICTLVEQNREFIFKDTYEILPDVNEHINNYLQKRSKSYHMLDIAMSAIKYITVVMSSAFSVLANNSPSVNDFDVIMSTLSKVRTTIILPPEKILSIFLSTESGSSSSAAPKKAPDDEVDGGVVKKVPDAEVVVGGTDNNSVDEAWSDVQKEDDYIDTQFKVACSNLELLIDFTGFQRAPSRLWKKYDEAFCECFCKLVEGDLENTQVLTLYRIRSVEYLHTFLYKQLLVYWCLILRNRLVREEGQRSIEIIMSMLQSDQFVFTIDHAKVFIDVEQFLRGRATTVDYDRCPNYSEYYINYTGDGTDTVLKTIELAKDFLVSRHREYISKILKFKYEVGLRLLLSNEEFVVVATGSLEKPTIYSKIFPFNRFFSNEANISLHTHYNGLENNFDHDILNADNIHELKKHHYIFSDIDFSTSLRSSLYYYKDTKYEKTVQCVISNKGLLFYYPRDDLLKYIQDYDNEDIENDIIDDLVDKYTFIVYDLFKDSNFDSYKSKLRSLGYEIKFYPINF